MTDIEPIESGLAILDKREADLIALREEGKALKINSPEDKEGYKKVREHRIKCKNAISSLETDAYDLRESAIKFQKTVIGREKELKSILIPERDRLQKEEDTYNQALEAIRLEKERKENERIQSRVNALAQFNYAVDVYELKIMTDEEYEALLAAAEVDYDTAQQKIQQEKAAEEQRRKEEEERLQKEREDLARQRAEQEARDAEFKAEQDRIRKEQEARERELQRQEEERIAKAKAEDDRLRAERRAFEEEKRKHEEEKRLEQVRVEAAEKAKLEEQARIKREAEEKAERERLEKEEAARQEALKPDKQKMLDYVNEIVRLSNSEPKVNDQAAVDLLATTSVKLYGIAEELKFQIDEL